MNVITQRCWITGCGDIVPMVSNRYMTGVEAVAGWTFITWSASDTFLEMMKTWDDGKR
jgi:hypothetical protein